MIDVCTTCATKLGNRYDSAHCETKLRPFGADRLIGFHCLLNFTDMLDVAALGDWETAITAGDIIISPLSGKLEIGDSSTETFEDGCGNLIPDVTTTPWTFTTPSTEEDYSDEDWWKNFHEDFDSWRFGWFTCEGRLVLEDDAISIIKAAIALPGAAAVDQPGFRFSLENIPKFEVVNGLGKSGQWKALGTFKHSKVLRSVEIPGLAALISANL